MPKYPICFRYWNATSTALNSHVVRSKAQKPSSIFGRVSAMLSGNADRAAERRATEATPKRSYGFNTKNLQLHSDKNSEDLYRYKNFSSDHMRAPSPPHTKDEEAKPLPVTGTFSFQPQTNESDESDDESKAVDKPKK